MPKLYVVMIYLVVVFPDLWLISSGCEGSRANKQSAPGPGDKYPESGDGDKDSHPAPGIRNPDDLAKWKLLMVLSNFLFV